MYLHSRRHGSTVRANRSKTSTSSSAPQRAVARALWRRATVHHGLTLVTNNTKHFQRIQDIQLEDWTI
jgi:hypothetical protein